MYAGVAHEELRHVVARGKDHDDAAGRRRELARVDEEVSEDLRDPRPVRPDPEGRGGDGRVDLDVRLDERRAVVVERPSHLVTQVDALAPQLDLAARDARDVEQVVDEPREVRGLTVDDGERAPGGVAARRRALEDVHAVADGIEEIVLHARDALAVHLDARERANELSVRVLVPLDDDPLVAVEAQLAPRDLGERAHDELAVSARGTGVVSCVASSSASLPRPRWSADFTAPVVVDNVSAMSSRERWKTSFKTTTTRSCGARRTSRVPAASRAARRSAGEAGASRASSVGPRWLVNRVVRALPDDPPARVEPGA
jgi:hypothetical protein